MLGARHQLLQQGVGDISQLHRLMSVNTPESRSTYGSSPFMTKPARRSRRRCVGLHEQFPREGCDSSGDPGSGRTRRRGETPHRSACGSARGQLQHGGGRRPQKQSAADRLPRPSDGEPHAGRQQGKLPRVAIVRIWPNRSTGISSARHASAETQTAANGKPPARRPSPTGGIVEEPPLVGGRYSP